MLSRIPRIGHKEGHGRKPNFFTIFQLSHIINVAMQQILSFLFSPDKIFLYFGKILSILLSLIFIYFIYKLLLYALIKFFKTKIMDEKLKMIEGIITSSLRYLSFFIAFITVLQQVGINVSAILASAGILGLAVSFGAQNLVKDLIAGVFILLENQYSVGDRVQIAGITGKVEKISLRLTLLRDEKGTLHSIPNGSITTVQNFNR